VAYLLTLSVVLPPVTKYSGKRQNNSGRPEVIHNVMDLMEAWARNKEPLVSMEKAQV
jgi:hypothetical protein